MVRTPRSISDYDALFDPVRQRRQAVSGKQLGDPDKAARAMLQIIDSDTPPVHLLLGSDALTLVREKTANLLTELGRWEELTRFNRWLTGRNSATGATANRSPRSADNSSARPSKSSSQAAMPFRGTTH